MSDKVKRRDFLKGATTGVGLGMLGAMGLYSYSPLRKQHFPEVTRKMTDIGVCKSVKVTNISETSWFENAVLMGDIKGAGGLLVNQYDYNWPPFGNGQGLGKGSYQEGIDKIKHLLPDKLDEAWKICTENCVHPENAGATPPWSKSKNCRAKNASSCSIQAGATPGPMNASSAKGSTGN